MHLSTLRRASSPTAACALALLGTLAPQAAASDLPGCTSRPLPLSVVFVSATQTDAGDLLIADYNNRQIVEVDLPAGSWGSLQGTTGEYVKMVEPISIRRVGDEIWLERNKAPRGIVALDSNLGVRSAPPRPLLAAFDRDRPADDDELRALWLWEPVNGTEVAACGRVLDRGTAPDDLNSNWRTAFVRYSLGAPGDFEVLKLYDPGQLAAMACRLKLPVIATLGDTVYFLGLEDDGAVVYAAGPDAEAQPLAVVPGRFGGRLLQMTENPHYSRVPALLEELTRLSMPVGLFAWEDALYLLSRSPDGLTSAWWLTRIRVDAEGREPAMIQGSVRLDSDADHLMVVPGDRHWALIEKGPADSYTRQSVHRVITVPAERLRAAQWQQERDAARYPSLCGLLDSAG